jgi:hypothetical protein
MQMDIPIRNAARLVEQQLCRPDHLYKGMVAIRRAG